jgi:UDP:flavonoid glycosyltransferase YjiC (YdhE family)
MVRPGSHVAATLLEAVEESGLRALWAWGKGDSPEIRGELAGRIRFEPWVPQPELLAHPSVAAVLTHGGSGTVQEALWFGKPLVGIPWAWDQRYNVRQVEQLGAGIRLSRERLRVGATARALRSVATAPPFLDRAAELGRELRASEGSGEVMEIVEALACR